jgi:FtsH-binding integral membrane protein
MRERRHMLPVWFFIGMLLTIYGVIILITSIVDWSQPSQAILAQYHPGLWGGILLLLIGSLYVLKFRPRRPSSSSPNSNQR